MLKALKSKPRVSIVLIICVLFIAYSILNAKFKPILPDDEFAFSPTPQNGQIGGIEGVYYYRASSPIEILSELSCHTEGWDNCTSYHMLRFYDDGVVLSTSIGTDDGIKDEDSPNVERWFNRDTEEIPHGKYFISGKKIWFSTSITYNDIDRTVTTDYSGWVLGNMLLLNGYSHFNGNNLSNMLFTKLNNGH